MSCWPIGQILRNRIRFDRKIAIVDEPANLLSSHGLAANFSKLLIETLFLYQVKSIVVADYFLKMPIYLLVLGVHLGYTMS
jgi:hypothetical protein